MRVERLAQPRLDLVGSAAGGQLDHVRNAMRSLSYERDGSQVSPARRLASMPGHASRPHSPCTWVARRAGRAPPRSACQLRPIALVANTRALAFRGFAPRIRVGAGIPAQPLCPGSVLQSVACRATSPPPYRTAGVGRRSEELEPRLVSHRIRGELISDADCRSRASPVSCPDRRCARRCRERFVAHARARRQRCSTTVGRWQVTSAVLSWLD
jgi:hypothetical protein